MNKEKELSIYKKLGIPKIKKTIDRMSRKAQKGKTVAQFSNYTTKDRLMHCKKIIEIKRIATLIIALISLPYVIASFSLSAILGLALMTISAYACMIGNYNLINVDNMIKKSEILEANMAKQKTNVKEEEMKKYNAYSPVENVTVYTMNGPKEETKENGPKLVLRKRV